MPSANCCAADRLDAPAAGVATVTVEQLAQGFEAGLLKADRPYVLPVTAENRSALEQLVFSGAYKGVTDLVTKWLWPRPAQWVTRACVRMGITPNQVTAASLVLVIVAGVLFARGEYGWGLLAGWIMTFLDTVDGKLARVTVTSTQAGKHLRPRHRSHPSAAVVHRLGYRPRARIRRRSPASRCRCLYVVILAGYVGGRLCEGAFQRWIAPFSIFTWRPFDSWFRLIVARRNPNMIMLTVSLARRPAGPGPRGGRRVDRAVDGDSPRAAAAVAAREAALRHAEIRGSRKSARPWTRARWRCGRSPMRVPAVRKG